RQRLEMLLGRVGRAEAELAGDLHAGGGKAGVGDVLLDQLEDFLLSGGECAHVGAPVVIDMPACIFIQSVPELKQGQGFSSGRGFPVLSSWSCANARACGRVTFPQGPRLRNEPRNTGLVWGCISRFAEIGSPRNAMHPTIRWT